MGSDYLNLNDITVKKIVYKITNTVNGKVYIGITSGSLQRRINNHLTHALRNADIRKFNKTGRKLYIAIREFGIESFSWMEIDHAFERSDVMALEQEYIKVFDSYNNGYNETLGGEGVKGLKSWNKGLKGEQVAWNKGIARTEEEKIKQSISMKGKPGLSGVKNPMYGKPGNNNRQVVAIDVVTKKIIGKYPSVKICGDSLPISHGSVKKILMGVFESIKGIKVEYDG